MSRSQFLGVYTIPESKRRRGGKYRVAVKVRNRKTREFEWFNVAGQFSTELVAAKVYNAYAVALLGRGAIINDIPDDVATMSEEMEILKHFMSSEDAGRILDDSTTKKHDLKRRGHTFRVHTEVIKS